MSISKHWSSRYINSLWSETNETWNDNYEDWRIVGSNPFNRRLDIESNKLQINLLYIIEFPSKRLDIAYSMGPKINKNTYVILEADRGEDCGIVKGYTTKTLYDDLIRRHKNLEKDLKIKKIYRIANDEDFSLLEERKKMVKSAVIECRNHVNEKGLKMEILDFEYQFDLNKITFFYKSEERIDFRELVKDLYKSFKTRIWMCSVDKSMDKLLNDIIKE